jgi:hypothetical protein
MSQPWKQSLVAVKHSKSMHLVVSHWKNESHPPIQPSASRELNPFAPNVDEPAQKGNAVTGLVAVGYFDPRHAKTLVRNHVLITRRGLQLLLPRPKVPRLQQLSLLQPA